MNPVPARRADWLRLAGAAIIAAVAIAAYSRTFSVPLLFDDNSGIADNPSIRHWSTALFPPSNTGAGGRPILNLSLAINYAISGTAVWSYHALNLAIHVLAGLVLCGILRRTLASRGDRASSLIGLSAALLWTVHPLLTESVTLIIQRTESLMGLFYLFTLYCFIRGIGAERAEASVPHGGRASSVWLVLCVATCLLGMATKEVMASAPLMVLLYDRTFLAGSFRAAWQRRPALYLCLGCTWILLAILMVSSQKRGGTVGFGLGVSSWDYALTQCRAVVLYLKLSVWPHPLVVDYGRTLVRSALEVWSQALLLILLGAGTVVSLWRRPALGFVGAWFFMILAPSSSVVPLATQTMAEHRMYLPLAAVMTLAAIGIHTLAGRRSWLVFAVLTLGLGTLTVLRNEDYRSVLAIWSDTVAKRPDNERAHYNLGLVWSKMPGRLNDAIAQYEEALRLQPDFAEAHNNLGLAWSQLPGRVNDAIAEYREALRLTPDYAEARNNLGVAWAPIPGRRNDAIAQFEEALRLKPDFAEAHNNLGLALSHAPGRLNDAIAEYEEALRLKPDDAEAHYNLGNAWSRAPGHLNDAVSEYEEALRLKPDYAEARNNLGVAWSQIPERLNDAIGQYQEALRLKPEFAEAHNNLGLAWSREPGRLNDAIAEYREALRLQPDYSPAWHNLGTSLYYLKNFTDAAAAFREELRLSPDDSAARQALAAALRQAPEH